ncbi:GntR family transcriptional regulator [Kocuria sp. M4R2S49]|uniref:GntR family transcriptional regulator n=1 Tax=Kocuria rhizosphaericola TaxID=3376284 RepID=UPI00379F4274
MSITPLHDQDEPLSLADRAFLQLQDRLIFLDIPPGAPLNEGRLSQELQLGRTPLREALKRLESERLVVTYSRRGTFATTVDITALSEISQVREVLEPLAARLAAERRGGDSRSQLEALRDRLASPGNERLPKDEALRWDVRIHRAIYAAAGNSHLQVTLERYSNLATRIWCVVADRIPELQEHITVHSALLTAVLAGDAEEAGTIMLQHVQDFETQIRQVL